MSESRSPFASLRAAASEVVDRKIRDSCGLGFDGGEGVLEVVDDVDAFDGDVDDGAFLAVMAGRDPATGTDLGRRYGEGSVRGFPFTGWDANQAWLQTVMWAADLATWFQLLCLTGPLAKAKPRRLRWTFWHAPARIIRTARRDVVRILDGWPTADEIVAAYRAIAALT